VLAALLIRDGAAGETRAPLQRLGEPFDLKVAHAVSFPVDGKDLTIRFLRVVEDSRCPVDVTCVWEGDAVARFELERGSETASFELHTAASRARFHDAGELRVRLVQLAPARRSGSAPKSDEYVATLVIERKSKSGGHGR